MFVRVGQCVPASQVAASSIRRVRRNSGPMAGALLLQLCKTSKKRNYTDIIGSVMFVQHAETQKNQDHAEILSRHTKGILMDFGFSFPSRANVVKVTHLNVTGSEALISWASGTNVPWPFKEHNVTILNPP